MRTLQPHILALALVFAVLASSVWGTLGLLGHGPWVAWNLRYSDEPWLVALSMPMLWSLLAPATLRARMLTLVLAYAAISALLIRFGEWPTYWLMLERHVMQFLSIASAIWLLKCFGLRLQAGLQQHKQRNVSPRGVHSASLTLRELAVWIAAIALLLAMVRYIKPMPGSFRGLANHFAIGLGYGLVAFATVWLALGTRYWPLRVIAVPVAILAAAILYCMAWRWILHARFPAGSPWLLPRLVSEPLMVYALLLLAPLWIFRMYGYRLYALKVPE